MLLEDCTRDNTQRTRGNTNPPVSNKTHDRHTVCIHDFQRRSLKVGARVNTYQRGRTAPTAPNSFKDTHRKSFCSGLMEYFRAVGCFGVLNDSDNVVVGLRGFSPVFVHEVKSIHSTHGK